MKGSTQRDIIILGKMQAVHDAMNMEMPRNKELRRKWLDAKRQVYHVLNDHWNEMNKLVTEDDT